MASECPACGRPVPPATAECPDCGEEILDATTETPGAKLPEYASLQQFYDEEPERRRRSPESDYGVHWTVGGKDWPRWRVSYIQRTGEVYAFCQRSADGQVRVLGIVPTDPDTRFEPGGTGIGGPTYYETLNRILDGWADPDVSGHDLAWVERRLEAAGEAQTDG